MKNKIYLFVFILIFNNNIFSQRSIPDDNLAYPVLIILSGGGSGTGFFVNSVHGVFLVTAKHVLFDQNSKLRSTNCDLISYSKDPKENVKNHFRVSLGFMNENKLLNYNQKYDVAVLKISPTSSLDTHGYMNLYDSVKIVSNSSTGIVCVNEKNVKRFDDVLVANDIYIFGYPTSLGIADAPQFDYLKPLLRKGIIAGKYDVLKTLILDCPVYFGNSGGPVLESTFIGTGYEFKVIGVVSEFIPFAERWINETQRYSNINISNSGYSVCTSMDVVLEMLK